jgi:hypothetical protein
MLLDLIEYEELFQVKLRDVSLEMFPAILEKNVFCIEFGNLLSALSVSRGLLHISIYSISIPIIGLFSYQDLFGKNSIKTSLFCPSLCPLISK